MAAGPHLALVGPIAPWRGGIAQYNTLLQEELARRARVDFYSFRRQYPAWLYPGASDTEPELPPGWQGRPGVEYSLDGCSPWSWIRLALRLDRGRPDALVVTWAHPFWTPHFLLLCLLVRLLTPIKLLFVAHNVVAHDAGRLARLCSALVLRLGHGHLVHSTQELARLARLAPAAGRVQANMPPHFPPVSEQPGRARARAQLGFQPTDRLLLFFGFVRPYKGLPMALEALARPDADGVRLLVAGEFWHGKEAVTEQIRALGLGERVTVIDAYATPDQTAGYFAACDAVLLPYHSATGSGILPLAYLFGRPVIATRVGSFADCVDPERTGLLVEPTAEALAGAIGRFFAAFDVDGAPARIADYLARELSWDALIDRLLGLLPAAVPRPGSPTSG